MRTVNLAQRPFVNRRPILRLAVVLWLVGAALLFLNIRLFTGHFRGTAGNQARLLAVDAEVREADARLRELDPDLSRIDLSRENGQTKFLNSLIAYRKFPWSALFDDLEQVVPMDVRLLSVKPAVQLVAEPVKAPRRRRRSTATRRAADRDETQTEPATSSARQNEAEPRQELRRNEVVLDLAGIARTEDALSEFIDTLYANPSFRDPFLPGESLQQGETTFSIGVIYLTRPAYDAASESENGEQPGGDLAQVGVAEEPTEQLGEAGEELATELAAAPKGLAPAIRPVTPSPAAGAGAQGKAAGGQSGAGSRETSAKGRGSARPGSGGGASAGGAPNLPGSEPEPSATLPGFATPPASATPALQSGSLFALPSTAFAVEAWA